MALEQPLERVLYVDDDEALTELAELVLDAADISVHVCHSGHAAVAEAPGFAPQLLLLDVEMPDMDGPETYAALRAMETLRTVPVVFMTAESDPQRIAELKALGACAIIAKPIDPGSLASELMALYAAHA